MPLSHRLSRALLSAVILLALVVGGYEAHRHGLTGHAVHIGQEFAASVKKLWKS